MPERSTRTAGGAPDPGLPNPDPGALAHSRQLHALIAAEIRSRGGLLPFDRFMELALYAPGLGYYTAGSRKFGEAGDFITAPEVSPLFARCVARQARQILTVLGDGDILEVGAGSGVLAAELLAELERLDALPGRMRILELSPELRQRQQDTLRARVPALYPRIRWEERLPAHPFRGLVLANELLDAMPVHRFRIGGGATVTEEYVRLSGGELDRVFDVPVSPGLAAAVAAIGAEIGGFDEGYESEVNLRAGPWLEALAGTLTAGAVLLIDYGYTRAGFYHPERRAGTLMCHYRHRAHSDPLRLPGLQDITAQVDFTAVAEAGTGAGFDLAGFTTQAHFLLGCGLDRLIADSDPQDTQSHLRLMQEVKRLTLPSEMGERFKVLALTRALDTDLDGFAVRDLRDRL